MDTISLLFLLLLAALGWFWFDSLRALESARNMGKHVCSVANVQFLNDTVANIAIALACNKSRRMVLRRTYRFEFSETGNTRLEGRLILLGDKIEKSAYLNLPDVKPGHTHCLSPDASFRRLLQSERRKVT